MADIVQPSQSRPKQPHTVIIAKGDDIRHFQVRPWVIALAGSVFSAVAIGYLLATTYLVLRDDLLNASVARQARLQQSYEDRISALRRQVDRITSRQMLDQQQMETKVGELLARQSQLQERHGRLGPLLDRLGEADAASDEPAPGLPSSFNPDLRASIDAEVIGGIASAGGETVAIANGAAERFAPNETDQMFAEISQALRTIEADQVNRIDAIADGAYETADAIASALREAGLEVDIDQQKAGLGGPLVAMDSPALFETKVKELDEALDLVDRMKSEARRLPIANPSPGHSVSSVFGVRKDPLLGTPAMHSGMDFRAPTGAEILAAAAGTVVSAGWNGGYGRMVEVRHADGFTTRYAHMSKILVKTGDEVSAGQAIGKVGSSGRSTGPHLHYEVHRHGKALNPVRFLQVGRKLSQYL